ncbi:MAG TPA: hypothetical protein VFV93_18780 [Thermomicrobiales bacterium]|nr:hypothetical protein [Thermomicrobiales bacterium]
MTRILRRLILRLVALQAVLLLVLTPTALAANPTPGLTPPPPSDAICSTSPHGTICHVDGAFTREDPELTVCDNVVVDGSSSGTASRKLTYDATGALVKEQRHVRFTGTLTNRSSGESIGYAGTFSLTFDFVAQTVTITGSQVRLLLPDGGVDVVQAGRVVVDLSQDPPVEVFLAGPKEADARICANLA